MNYTTLFIIFAKYKFGIFMNLYDKNQAIKTIYKFFFVLLFFNISIGQTKKETEEWIEGKYGMYKLDIFFEKNKSLEFNNGYLYVFDKGGLNYNEITYERIALKDVAEILVENTGDRFKEVRYHVDLICKVNKDCIESGRYVSGQFIKEYGAGNWHIQGKNNKYFIRLTLNENFKEDDLPKRMEKALLYLIKLNGGTAKKFVYPKEAF